MNDSNDGPSIAAQSAQMDQDATAPGVWTRLRSVFDPQVLLVDGDDSATQVNQTQQSDINLQCAQQVMVYVKTLSAPASVSTDLERCVQAHERILQALIA